MPKGKFHVGRSPGSGAYGRSKNKANASPARRAKAPDAPGEKMSDATFRKMFTKVSANDIMLSDSELKKFKKRYLSKMYPVKKSMGASIPKPPTR